MICHAVCATYYYVFRNLSLVKFGQEAERYMQSPSGAHGTCCTLDSVLRVGQHSMPSLALSNQKREQREPQPQWKCVLSGQATRHAKLRSPMTWGRDEERGMCVSSTTAIPICLRLSQRLDPSKVVSTGCNVIERTSGRKVRIFSVNKIIMDKDHRLCNIMSCSSFATPGRALVDFFPLSSNGGGCGWQWEGRGRSVSATYQRLI